MYANGLLHEWIQQNHDGLPQKAGMPQAGLNEIHGSWFDPCNPVVPMSGRLRGDLVRRLRETTKNSDLVIALGTSLSGVMADQIVSSVGRRAAEAREGQGKAPAAGASRPSSGASCSSHEPLVEAAESAVAARPSVVIINAQQTRLDGVASLRIFAKLDDVLKQLCKELGLAATGIAATHEAAPRRAPKEDVWEALPYGEDGLPCSDGTLTLDLTRGKKVVLTDGNPPLVKPGTAGVVGPKTKQGHYTVVLEGGKSCTLGVWHLHEAKAGTLPRLPLINAQRASSDTHVHRYIPSSQRQR